MYFDDVMMVYKEVIMIIIVSVVGMRWRLLVSPNLKFFRRV